MFIIFFLFQLEITTIAPSFQSSLSTTFSVLSTEETLSIYFIVMIVAIVVLLISIIIGIVVWKKKQKNNSNENEMTGERNA